MDEQTRRAHGAGAGAAGEPGGPPHGWYYFGPEPPWAGGAPHHGRHHDDRRDSGRNRGHDGGHANADLMEAFDRMSRGDLGAETIGKLFDVTDRDFWKGALVGSAAALALSNLPALKALFGAAVASAGGAMAKPAAAGARDKGEDDAA
jgi:hypothetical protein